ncbi:hypothetical protein CL633_03465 [bacterium]|nr:hypothetical protein [bacterium]|tara:strand:- start:26106 stop:26501 length:396 start_codon:yes stop_codon:yes gene_type:complete
MKEDNFKKLSKEWFKKADDDMLFAKAGFKESGIAGNACFLCQQVAEKYLKGYLVSQGIEPKRTHNIPELLLECIKINKTFSEIEQECKFLNQFYNPVRYPSGLVLDFDKDTANKAFESAEFIVQFIKQIIF